MLRTLWNALERLSEANPKLYTLVWAAATVLFIILSSLAVASLARLLARLFKKDRLYQQRTFGGYLFASPWIVGFLLFVLVPTGLSLYWSLTRYELPNPPQWLGLDNYVKLLTGDPDFRVSLLNSLYMTLFGLPLQLGTSLVLALILYQKLRGERAFRIIFYLPVMLASSTAMLTAWRLVFNPNNGILNLVLRGLGKSFRPADWLIRAAVYIGDLAGSLFTGLQRGNFNTLQSTLAQGFPRTGVVPLWHQSPLWSKPALIIIGVWSSGAMMLIYLAALHGIPTEILEAARVDGASSWQLFRRIMLPLISPATFYNLVIGIITTLQIFEQAYVLSDAGGPAQSQYFVAYYLYRSTFRFNKVGYGAAMSWILLLILLIFTLFQFRLSTRWVHYD